MRQIAKSVIPFCKSTWYVLGCIAMTIWNPDPFLWLRERNLIGPDTLTHVTAAERQIAFAVALIVLMFVWFHRQRSAFEEREPPTPDLPLHKALRYIAKDSVWATSYDYPDYKWVIYVGNELMSKLHQGRVLAWGTQETVSTSGGSVEDEIPAAFLKGASGDWHRLVRVTPPTEPPTHLYKPGAGAWRLVRLSRAQLEHVWPRRSLWSRLLGKSPVERIEGHWNRLLRRGYAAIWKQQDDWYQNFRRGID